MNSITYTGKNTNAEWLGEWHWGAEPAQETIPCLCWDTCTCSVGSEERNWSEWKS